MSDGSIEPILTLDVPTLAYEAELARCRGDKDAAITLIQMIYDLIDCQAAGQARPGQEPATLLPHMVPAGGAAALGVARV